MEEFHSLQCSGGTRVRRGGSSLDEKLHYIFKIFLRNYIYILILNLLNIRLEVGLVI